MKKNRLGEKYAMGICPICLQMMVNPATTPCDHTFCRDCIVRYHKMGKMECAMCREYIPLNFQFPIDQIFRDKLEKAFGFEFRNREREVAS